MNRLLTLATAFILTAVANPVLAQVTQSYSYTEYAATPGAQDAMVFGFAAYKICQIKSFLFMAVYILGAIAFVIFAIKALFTKFEIKQFLPILGALFIVATADLLVAFFSTSAFYCPTVFSTL